LHALAPLKPEHLEHVDVMIVRELTGGIYFGEKKREGDVATDVCRYDRGEIARITRKACRIARQRNGRITLVDKANVLETSRLWREVSNDVINNEFPDIDLEFMLVDAAAMHLLSNPRRFDVLLTENLFGDILSDEASMLCGSLGVLPSASLGEGAPGVFEPCHGSAPDIAGQGIANPYGMLLSLAMMLRHSLQQIPAAALLENCVHQCWQDGILTPDLAADGCGTTEATNAVCALLDADIDNQPPARTRD
jgi:3-isopropylmalate dehydrogenase